MVNSVSISEIRSNHRTNLGGGQQTAEAQSTMSSADMTDDNESSMFPSLDESAAAEMVLVAMPEYARVDALACRWRRQVRHLLKL